MQVILVTMTHPTLRTDAPSPCLPMGIKDLLKEDQGFWMKGGFLDVGRLWNWGLAEGKLLDGDS
jgi:hypothetical protein